MWYILPLGSQHHLLRGSFYPLLISIHPTCKLFSSESCSILFFHFFPQEYLMFKIQTTLAKKAETIRDQLLYFAQLHKIDQCAPSKDFCA